jgi:Ca2+-binding RTX toxin-like protein
MAHVKGTNPAGQAFDYATGVTDSQDLIEGNVGPDAIFGRGGDDYIKGGGGADWLHGGDGSDTALYLDSLSAVEVNLVTGKGKGGTAEGDTLLSIENVVGSDFNDTIIGNTEDNRLEGGKGHDILKGGGGMDRLFGGEGNDVLEVDGLGDFVNGGDGIDTLVLKNSEYGVWVNLEHGILHSNGVKKGIPPRSDRVTDVENVAGTEFSDQITGDNGANLLNGLGGHDRIFGGHGKDNLFGEDGDDLLNGGFAEDKLTGGAGVDTFQYSNLIDSVWIAGKPGDQILDFEKGIDKIDLESTGLDFGDLTFKNNQTIDGENYTYFGYDANNNGTFDIAEFCVAVKMTPGVALSASDFLFA